MLAKMANVYTKHPLGAHLSHIQYRASSTKKGRPYILSTRQFLGVTDYRPGSPHAGVISKNYIL